MKNDRRLIFCTVLALISFVSTAFANDWDLFHGNTGGYYKSTDPYNCELHYYNADSIITAANTRTFYFNTKALVKGMPAACDSFNDQNSGGKIAAADINDYFKPYVPFNADPFTSTSGIFNCSPLGIDVFNPLAGLGQPWTTNSTVTFECVLIANETFLGITDSVKTFQITSSTDHPNWLGLNFKVSKNYGFIQFYNLEFTPEKYSLIGIALSNGQKYGFASPDFSDYFHLNAGDVLLWKSTVDYPDPSMPTWIRYFKDSLTSASHYADSVRYNYIRTTSNATGVFTSNHSDLYLKSEFDKLLYNTMETGSFVHFNVDWMNDLPLAPTERMAWTVKQVYVTDSINNEYQLQLHSYGYIIEANACNYRQLICSDYPSAYLDTIAGYVKKVMSGSGYSEEALVGYKINGVLKGSIILGTQEHGARNFISLYPNPVNSEQNIFLDQPADHITMYDLSGRVITNGEGLVLSTRNIAPGIYIVNIEKAKQHQAVRVVIR
jgi:hypothetical protein